MCLILFEELFKKNDQPVVKLVLQNLVCGLSLVSFMIPTITLLKNFVGEIKLVIKEQNEVNNNKEKNNESKKEGTGLRADLVQADLVGQMLECR